ncbi:4'-phosphopantetheinyl transferase entD [Labilithrix luteola]|uniref:Enterobactin synthase component D n=1 Tax=Labilithrix luteola TaxID=1391654 RepID=A0A0K1PY73_9BACT|nr:4'-phosphopantetheinyl transferase superfamily protein [Labilithrix luteola]AKU98457.1 4'-phosphopantetheinyl transferase entD [Labilithrix luteola]
MDVVNTLRTSTRTSLLTTLFRSGAVIVESATSLVDDQLFPEEVGYLKNAVPERRAEFGTARVCARKALAEMGFAPTALVPTDDRAPVWPAGVVGSIAHTRDYCAVVVHRSPPMRAVGVDAEIVRRLEPSTIELIATPAERARMYALGDVLTDDLPILLFSAKEAYYKCQYPLSKTMLDFQDVEIRLAPAARRFEARARKPSLPECVKRLEGKYVFDRGLVLCGVELSE